MCNRDLMGFCIGVKMACPTIMNKNRIFKTIFKCLVYTYLSPVVCYCNKRCLFILPCPRTVFIAIDLSPGLITTNSIFYVGLYFLLDQFICRLSFSNEFVQDIMYAPSLIGALKTSPNISFILLNGIYCRV